jgi:hypothetical protein
MVVTARFALLFTLFFAVSLIYFIDIQTGMLRIQLPQRSFVGAPIQPLRSPAHRLDRDCLVCE